MHFRMTFKSKLIATKDLLGMFIVMPFLLLGYLFMMWFLNQDITDAFHCEW